MTSRRTLSTHDLERLAAEIDELRANTKAVLGERDARYIRRIFAAVRWSEALGRGLLVLGFFLASGATWLLGALLLGLSKILDNMELGHNVIHGQYDWMGDPHLNGRTFEWDIAGTSANWRKTHNFKHHTYTNIQGKDDDIGYGVLRLFPEQKWSVARLFQPLYAVIFAILFEWGVAIQDLRIGRLFIGKMTLGQLVERHRDAGRKMRRQILKDYVVWPLLTGPAWLWVLSGNALANVLRSLWTYLVIFCGHFTADVEIFPKSVLEHETRGAWYLRQILGSSNLSGGRLLHILTGNLSHQIEHHLFPDIPSVRYAEMAPAVQDICRRYGIRYSTGSLVHQFAEVVWRILRHSLPSRPSALPRLVEQNSG